MVEREVHERVLVLLDKLDVELLHQAECWFGGGTAVALRCGEFRVSSNVDFLCASRAGYRSLRQRVYEAGARGLFLQDVALVRDVRADRYGIRLVAEVGGEPMKMEIVSEGRIDLEGTNDDTLPVRRLADADLVATKLLANEDRFLDDATLARDLIDLVMLDENLGGLPEEAWEKARSAYGPSVDDAYRRAQERIRSDPVLLARAYDQLSVTPAARAIIHAHLGLSTPPGA